MRRLSTWGALLIVCMLIGCAGTGSPPAPSVPEQAPILLSDARTGFALRVPEGWAVAPPAVYDALEADQVRPPRRLLFALVHEQSASNGEIVLLVAAAEPLGAVPDVSCSELSRQQGFQALGAEERPKLRIGRHELCSLRVPNSQGRPLYVWSGRAGNERLDLFSSPSDELSGDIDQILTSARFETAAPDADVTASRGRAVRSIHDDATRVSLVIPSGWSTVPGSQVRKLMAGASTLQGPGSERFVFLLVRDDTFSKPEVVGFVEEMQAANVVQPQPLDDLCESLLAVLKLKDVEAVREANRTIGGRAFCSFRFASGDRSNLVFANLAGGSIHRFQVALAGDDRSHADALIDAIRFE